VTPEELHAWRKLYGMSQDELAEALEVHRLTVSKWERGEHEIPGFLHLALDTLARTRRKRPRRTTASSDH
jgi:DNA-binding transcriptional regulator YiaG